MQSDKLIDHTSFKLLATRYKPMIIDGKKIRDEILAELNGKFTARRGAVLAVAWVGDDPATAKFIEQKQKFAALAGVELRLFEYDSLIDQTALEGELTRLAIDSEIDGIIVQLPLPAQIETEKIIALIPPEKDVDALGAEARVESPVVAAVAEILTRYDIPFSKKFAVLGQGKLVGRPVAIWLAQNGAEVAIADSRTSDLGAITADADVIISGVGQPGLLTPDLIKPQVVLIDAGTNEQAGKLAGDIDPACAAKASLFTPVPGGVGPIVIAELFNNLWKLLP